MSVTTAKCMILTLLLIDRYFRESGMYVDWIEVVGRAVLGHQGRVGAQLLARERVVEHLRPDDVPEDDSGPGTAEVALPDVPGHAGAW